jgi:trans-aconitate 2-methyltransferase
MACRRASSDSSRGGRGPGIEERIAVSRWNPEQYLKFEAERLRPALDECYPRRPDGRTLYPFRRLFLVLVR